jgi:hypothetical protein
MLAVRGQVANSDHRGRIGLAMAAFLVPSGPIAANSYTLPAMTAQLLILPGI